MLNWAVYESGTDLGIRINEGDLEGILRESLAHIADIQALLRINAAGIWLSGNEETERNERTWVFDGILPLSEERLHQDSQSQTGLLTPAKQSFSLHYSNTEGIRACFPPADRSIVCTGLRQSQSNRDRWR